MKQPEKYLINKILAFLLISSLIFTSCSSNRNSANDVSSGTPVEITHPQVKAITDYLSLNANTVFLNKEIIRASFQGFIEKIYKDIGDKVSPGDILFRIKTREYAAADSMKIKIGDKLFSGSVFIKAKSSGVLTQLNYHSGDFISDGEQLAIISNPASLRIKLNVPYEENLNIKIGKRCEVDLPDDTNLLGVISKSVPSVDPNTQTQTYLIKIYKAKELPENLNAIVKIPVATFKDAVVVPKSAVNTDVTESSFWLVRLVNDTTAVKVDIKKGIESDSLVQILEPQLNTTDRIVTTGSYALPDTAKVEIVK